MKREWDLISVGDVFVDIVLSGLPGWPRPGEEVFAQLMQKEAGGAATITACGLAKLGSRVALIAVAGGEDSDWLVQRVASCGVETGGLRYHPNEATGLTVSVSTRSDRSFLTYFGANQMLADLLRDSATVRGFARAQHVHLTCAPEPQLLSEMIRSLHADGSSVSVDVGWKEEWLKDKLTLQALSEVDIFFPNEHEAQMITGRKTSEDILAAFSDAGLHRVALKLGSRGSALSWNGQILTAEPYPVEPLDTTGAGDCFDAGFLFAWMQGQSPEVCLQIGNICGALSTRGLGGISSFPTNDELEAIWKSQTTTEKQ